MQSLSIKPSHHGIAVWDMNRSIAWYQKVFGLEVQSDELSSDFGAPLNCRVVHMLSGDMHLELFEYLGEDKEPVPEESRNSVTDLRTCGNKHSCYETNIPRLVNERIIPNNVFIEHGPERQGDNWMLFLCDPDGILYEFHDVGGAARDPHAFDNFPCKLFD